MAYVESVNGESETRVESRDNIEGVLIPRILYIDGNTLRLDNSKITSILLNNAVSMKPSKIEGDAYKLDVSVPISL